MKPQQKLCPLRLDRVIVEAIEAKEQRVYFIPRLDRIVLKLVRQVANGSFVSCGKLGEVGKGQCVKLLFVEGLPVKAAAPACHETEVSEQY